MSCSIPIHHLSSLWTPYQRKSVTKAGKAFPEVKPLPLDFSLRAKGLNKGSKVLPTAFGTAFDPRLPEGKGQQASLQPAGRAPHWKAGQGSPTCAEGTFTALPLESFSTFKPLAFTPLSSSASLPHLFKPLASAPPKGWGDAFVKGKASSYSPARLDWGVSGRLSQRLMEKERLL